MRARAALGWAELPASAPTWLLGAFVLQSPPGPGSRGSRSTGLHSGGESISPLVQSSSGKEPTTHVGTSLSQRSLKTITTRTRSRPPRGPRVLWPKQAAGSFPVKKGRWSRTSRPSWSRVRGETQTAPPTTEAAVTALLTGMLRSALQLPPHGLGGRHQTAPHRSPGSSRPVDLCSGLPTPGPPPQLTPATSADGWEHVQKGRRRGIGEKLTNVNILGHVL